MLSVCLFLHTDHRDEIGHTSIYPGAWFLAVVVRGVGWKSQWFYLSAMCTTEL